MDPLVVNFSFGIVFTSASAGLWFLHREHDDIMKKYKGLESRFEEVGKIFDEIKEVERGLRKKQGKQASMHVLEEKIGKAEKELRALKVKAS